MAVWRKKNISSRNTRLEAFFLEMQNSLNYCHGKRRFYSGTNSLIFSNKNFFQDLMLIMSLLSVCQGLGCGFFLSLQQ